VPLQNVEVKEITSRLDILIKLQASLYAREINNNDAIVKLDRMQLSRDQIEEAVNVTTHNVAQVLYASKKAAEKKNKQTKPQPDPPETIPQETAEVQQ
jgi:hypothetical protein